MAKKDITVIRIYGKQYNARTLIKESFLLYLKNALICKKL